VRVVRTHLVDERLRVVGVAAKALDHAGHLHVRHDGHAQSDDSRWFRPLGPNRRAPASLRSSGMSCLHP